MRRGVPAAPPAGGAVAWPLVVVETWPLVVVDTWPLVVVDTRPLVVDTWPVDVAAAAASPFAGTATGRAFRGGPILTSLRSRSAAGLGFECHCGRRCCSPARRSGVTARALAVRDTAAGGGIPSAGVGPVSRRFVFGAGGGGVNLRGAGSDQGVSGGGISLRAGCGAGGGGTGDGDLT